MVYVIVLILIYLKSVISTTVNIIQWLFFNAKLLDFNKIFQFNRQLFRSNEISFISVFQFNNSTHKSHIPIQQQYLIQPLQFSISTVSVCYPAAAVHQSSPVSFVSSVQIQFQFSSVKSVQEKQFVRFFAGRDS